MVSLQIRYPRISQRKYLQVEAFVVFEFHSPEADPLENQNLSPHARGILDGTG